MFYDLVKFKAAEKLKEVQVQSKNKYFELGKKQKKIVTVRQKTNDSNSSDVISIHNDGLLRARRAILTSTYATIMKHIGHAQRRCVVIDYAVV